MKHYMILSLMMLPFVAASQTAETDSVKARELDEITVVADMQRTSPDKTVYMPSGKQKTAASDGISLLARMNIPQLSVNQIAGTVSTADNQSVSIFINYHPATDEDINGLNPIDVKRVEYLDFPADARFLHAQHVVNFITQAYTHGGYTKLSAKQRFMIHSGEGAVYSKFVCRQMEYDLMLSGDYDYNSNICSLSDETYRLPSAIVKRKSATPDSHYRQRGIYAAMRASWNKNKNFSFRNLVSYRGINTPENYTSGHVDFTGLYPSGTYISDAPSANKAIGWDSELFAVLGKGWSLKGNIEAEFRNNTTSENYVAVNSSIENHAKEKFWWLRGTAQVNKSLSEKVSVFTSISSGIGRTKIDYTGSSNAINRFRQTFTGIYVGTALNLNKVSGSIDGGFAFESNYINGKTMHDRYPFTHINVQYAPNQKHSLGLWFQYATFSPDAAMKNPNIIRQSEIMYISGNPDLKCARNVTANINYTWLPDNRWQMSAYALLFRIANRQIAVYTPDAPEGMMLKKYQNDGDYNHGQIGATLTGKFLEGKLSFSAAPRLLLYKTTGSNSISHYPFSATVNADYYLGRFSFNAYWASGSSYVDGETAYLCRMPASYSIGAGWAAKGWNIQLSVINPFRSSWEISKDSLRTKWYNSTITQLGSDYHRRISLSITYTFNYGKKISNSGELTGEKNISTSILR